MKNKTNRYMVNVDNETAKSLEKKANDEATSIAQIIRWAIKKYLAK